jgi:formate/nitrite transporter FocA (FNT family)
MVTKQYPWYFYLIVLLGNIIGVSLMALLAHNNASAAIATVKVNQPIWEAAARGIGCGMLMSLATYEKSPLWMCILCVMGFILGGFNHCIADAYYMIAAGTIGTSLIGTVIGNIFGGVIFSNLIEPNI